MTVAVDCPVLQKLHRVTAANRARKQHLYRLTSEDGIEHYCPILHGRAPCCPEGVTPPVPFPVQPKQLGF